MRVVGGRALVALAFIAVIACQTAATPGATCALASECSSGLVCRFGRCRAGCSVNRDCPAGASCLTSPSGGACSWAIDTGCQTGIGRDCSTGLLCVGDRCVATCSTARDCPVDGECRALTATASFCFDPANVGSDAGVLDAARLDAASDAARLDAASDAGVPSCASAPRVCALQESRACALVRGRVYCWGWDSGNRLGDGPTMAHLPGMTCMDCFGSATPVPVVHEGTTTPLDDMVDIACGGTHACARDAAGAMYCWGDDGPGELGDGTSSAPTGALAASTLALTPVDRMALGQSHTCVRLASTGALRCFGENGSGQIDPADPRARAGSPGAAPIFGPMATPMGEQQVSLVAASGTWTCAVTMLGDLHCWGFGDHGQTGTLPSAGLDHGTRVLASNVTSLALGYAYTCWLGAMGTRCVGADFGGVFGQATLATCAAADSTLCTATPTDPHNGSFTDLFGGAGPAHICARSGTAVVCWGGNDAGQIGGTVGNNQRQPIPLWPTLIGGATVCSMGLSSDETCVSLDDGRVLCGGADERGQRGDGIATLTHSASPALVVFPP